MSPHEPLDRESEAVRRLLASARHDEPTPAEVVDRLDDALAALVAERADSAAPVIDLSARRRRRVGAGILAAAAACALVAGVGPTLVNSGSDSDESTANSAAEQSSDAEDAAGPAQDDRPMAEAEPTPAPAPDDSEALTRKRDDLRFNHYSSGQVAILTSAGFSKAEQSALRTAVRRLRRVDAMSGPLTVLDSAGCAARVEPVAASAVTTDIRVGPTDFVVSVSAPEDGFRTITFTSCAAVAAKAVDPGTTLQADDAPQPDHVVRVR